MNKTMIELAREALALATKPRMHWQDLAALYKFSVTALPALAAEVLRLHGVLNDHGPEGRNVTNGQYVELLGDRDALRDELDRLTEEVARMRQLQRDTCALCAKSGVCLLKTTGDCDGCVMADVRIALLGDEKGDEHE